METRRGKGISPNEAAETRARLNDLGQDVLKLRRLVLFSTSGLAALLIGDILWRVFG